MQHVPTERAETFRQASTANLMLDSADATLGLINPADVLFNKKNSILNGFFTRLATTEVVLEWTTPNITTDLGRNGFTVTLSGPGAPAPVVLTIPVGFYNVAEAINRMIAVANANGTINAVGTFTATAIPGPGGVTISFSNPANGFQFTNGLPDFLDATAVVVAGATLPIPIGQQELRSYRYLDFVSPNLTYNQSLKDNSTYEERNVLCRWYFAFDEPPTQDAYGFPIMMGYTPFNLRRLFNPPKQIKWEPNMPIGQIAVQIFPNFGLNVANLDPSTNWLMTIQASEN